MQMFLFPFFSSGILTINRVGWFNQIIFVLLQWKDFLKYKVSKPHLTFLLYVSGNVLIKGEKNKNKKNSI